MAQDKETRIEVEKIRKDMRDLQSLIDRAISQLAATDRLNLSDDTPYFSFKTAERIEDLKGSGLKLRAALRHDIELGKAQLRQFDEKAKRIQREGYAAFVEREHAEIIAADIEADRRAIAIMNRAANARGYLTADEFAEVQKCVSQGLKAHALFLRAHPSKRALKETLDKLARAQSMGMDDTDVTNDAMVAIKVGSKKIVDVSKDKFLKRASPAAARALIGDIATNELLGGTDTSAYLGVVVAPKMKELAEVAEKRFRNTPTKENAEAMFNAEYACVSVGGPSLPDPPVGLRRIKPGKMRSFGPTDMLSAVSKEFYGSFGFWDVIVKANPGIFRDPDRPRQNVTITIPY